MPSASLRAVSSLTPIESRNATTTLCRSRRRGEYPSLAGQDHALIVLLQHQPLIRKPLQHLRDGGLRNAKAPGDIHLLRVPLGRDQIVDKLDVILHELQPVRLARLAEALRLDIGRDKGVGCAFLL